MKLIERKEAGLEEVLKLQKEGTLFKTYFKNGTEGLLRVRFTDEVLHYFVVEKGIQKIDSIIKTQQLPASVIEYLLRSGYLRRLTSRYLICYQQIPSNLIQEYLDQLEFATDEILNYQVLDNIELLKEIEEKVTMPPLFNFGNLKLITGESANHYFRERRKFKVRNGYLTGFVSKDVISNLYCTVHSDLETIRKDLIKKLSNHANILLKVRINIERVWWAQSYTDSEIEVRVDDVEVIKEVKLWRIGK